MFLLQIKFLKSHAEIGLFSKIECDVFKHEDIRFSPFVMKKNLTKSGSRMEVVMEEKLGVIGQVKKS